MDIEKYAIFHRKLLEAHKTEQQKINNMGYGLLKKIVAILRSKPTVTKVIVFGSLINGTFAKGSDIDIAVEGIPLNDFFAVWNEIEEKIGMEIDLIDLNPDFVPIYNIIQKTGRVVYEKS
jgi:predicted nucleotidyltransferase